MTTCQTSTCSPASEKVLKPRFEVQSNPQAYEVKVELPGVSKDNLTISLDENLLSIRAQRKSAKAEGWQTLYSELSHFNYALELKVNVPVNESALTAKLEDGVLTLTLPIKEAAKPRVIAVQ
ncbi:hypothetical protein BH11VER1_BH11VER1_37070 [soil metagenome]